MGRPSKKDTLDLSQVKHLARAGWTDEQMAEFFEVSIRTWHGWKANDDDFYDVLQSWKLEADERVERALYERATGYSHPEDRIFLPAGADEPVIVPTVKHYAPDTVSMIFWLKNRQPQEWRDKREHEHTGKDGARLLIGPDPMTEEEWMKEYGIEGTQSSKKTIN